MEMDIKVYEMALNTCQTGSRCPSLPKRPAFQVGSSFLSRSRSGCRAVEGSLHIGSRRPRYLMGNSVVGHGSSSQMAWIVVGAAADGGGRILGKVRHQTRGDPKDSEKLANVTQVLRVWVVENSHVIA